MPDLENQDHVRLRALLWQPNSPPTPYTIQESCESADECILDLVHYCQRRITKLVTSGYGGGGEGEMVEEMTVTVKEITF